MILLMVFISKRYGKVYLLSKKLMSYLADSSINVMFWSSVLLFHISLNYEVSHAQITVKLCVLADEN